MTLLLRHFKVDVRVPLAEIRTLAFWMAHNNGGQLTWIAFDEPLQDEDSKRALRQRVRDFVAGNDHSLERLRNMI